MVLSGLSDGREGRSGADFVRPSTLVNDGPPTPRRQQDRCNALAKNARARFAAVASSYPCARCAIRGHAMRGPAFAAPGDRPR